ncbi:hypothetical protein [Bartonella sp. ML69XJBT]|uniref:hypothetical protein n=1 Tax=Bartonella sp. ML69XJBT TaxID=3019092 RepID=UPI00235F2184|nr:hypothetical protein [Bartonella sp. ML69XJBT]
MIESWESIRQFAEEIGCSYEAARKMHDRNSISPKYWNTIIQVSKSKKDMRHLMEKFNAANPIDNNEHQQHHSHS